MAKKRVEDLNECPVCGHDQYYVKMQVIGCWTHNNQRFDGREAENGHIHDNLDYKFGKKCYCENCNKYLGTTDMYS